MITSEYLRKICPYGRINYEVWALLTYGLDPRPTKERTLLLTSQYRLFMNGSLAIDWDFLVNEINKVLSGNFSQDKSLVNEIRKYPGKYPKFSVAVHNHGSVPVLLTGEKHMVELHGREVEAEVAIYYSRDTRNDSSFYSFFPNKLVFIQSLTGTYNMVMRRYFEDVTQLLLRICRQATSQQVFKLCKLAEDLIGKSIKPKLAESIPNPPDWKKNKDILYNSLDEVMARCVLFEEHHSDILLAQHFRYTVLLFINELYRHLGIGSKSKYYLDRIAESIEIYDALQGSGAAETVVEEFDELGILTSLRLFYLQGSTSELDRIQSNSVWLQGLIEFAKLLINLNKNNVAPAKARIFISFNYNVTTAEDLKKQITEFYLHHYPGTIEILSVEHLPPGATFREIIKTRIFLSDKILVIIPKDTTKKGDDDPNGYKWQAIEAEHALLLEKEATYLLEKGCDRKILEDYLRDEKMEFLSPDARTSRPRPQNLLDNFRGKSQVSFTPATTQHPSWQDLSKEMQDSLKYVADSAITIRQDVVVKGFLSQFEESSLIVFKCLNELLPAGSKFTKEQAVLTLHNKYGTNTTLPFTTMASVRKAFNNLWANVKERSLVIDNKVYRVMIIEGKTNKAAYSFTWTQLLRDLRPDNSDAQIQEWERQLLQEVVAKKV